MSQSFDTHQASSDTCDSLIRGVFESRRLELREFLLQVSNEITDLMVFCVAICVDTEICRLCLIVKRKQNLKLLVC